MNSKASVNPTSIKWLAGDEQIVADYFLDLGLRSLKEILDMRVFDLMVNACSVDGAAADGKVTDWWENDVKPWFTLEKWKDLLSSIWKSISTTVSDFSKEWSKKFRTGGRTMLSRGSLWKNGSRSVKALLTV